MTKRFTDAGLRHQNIYLSPSLPCRTIFRTAAGRDDDCRHVAATSAVCGLCCIGLVQQIPVVLQVHWGITDLHPKIFWWKIWGRPIFECFCSRMTFNLTWTSWFKQLIKHLCIMTCRWNSVTNKVQLTAIRILTHVYWVIVEPRKCTECHALPVIPTDSPGANKKHWLKEHSEPTCLLRLGEQFQHQ